MDKRQTSGASDFQTDTSSKGKVTVKKEEDDCTAQHNHRFSIEFNNTAERQEIHCQQPQTVLDAIRSRDIYTKLKWSDRKIFIQKGSDDECIVATHFPCCCIEEGEVLIVSKTPDQVEEEREVRPLLSKEDYVIFYIDTTGGKNTKSKTLFISNEVKKFKFLCVYAEKGITVEEALKRDGRFDGIAGFKLTNKSDSKTVIQSNDRVDHLQGRKFKIELPREKGAKGKKPQDPRQASDKTESRSEREAAQERQVTDNTPGPSTRPEQTPDSRAGGDVVHEREDSVSRVDLEEIYQILREQYPGLKQLMESRFPNDSFQKRLEVTKKNFGKIQNTFRNFYVVQKLIEMGKSVCKVVVENKCEGTGFVLFKNSIITSGHLFIDCVEENKLKGDVNVNVIFNYKAPLPDTQFSFKVETSRIFYKEDELDYAVLQVQPEVHKSDQTEPITPPAGLLGNIGELPADGAACIIGHPGGEVKQIDLTSIIEMEKREQVSCINIEPHCKENSFILRYIEKEYAGDLGKIFKSKPEAQKGMTYNTFMFNGASGSPVFDAHGRVCGLHTFGFPYEVHNTTHSVIEFAYSMEIIMKHFVNMLIDKDDMKLLEEVRKVNPENSVLKKIFESVCERLPTVPPTLPPTVLPTVPPTLPPTVLPTVLPTGVKEEQEDFEEPMET